MADYKDEGHRPHARHTGETPANIIRSAPDHLTVTLDTWGPTENLFPAIYDALQANWGDAPCRTVDRIPALGHGARNTDLYTGDPEGWRILTPGEQAYVESCFAGKTLQQVLERITFNFLIDGCSRACTHQLVRTRLGAGMMQHGGRDNDWRHRPWVMPETIRRACVAMEVKNSADPTGSELLDATGLKHCITKWTPIDQYLDRHASNFDYQRKDGNLFDAIEMYLDEGRQLYAALVDAGIPWEDARRLLWMGTATYIHIDYNYIAFKGVLANRLEHVMDWEINCVAQLMLREVKMKCPPLLSKYLGSASDLAGVAKFAGLQSWTPDGKYFNPHERCGVCSHAKANHVFVDGTDLAPDNAPGPVEMCEVCQRESNDGHYRIVLHTYKSSDSLPREHRPEQNPFWILHPDSMNGGPIVWIPTNGTYPQELKK